MKGVNRWLKTKVKQLEKHNANLKTDLKGLEMIY